MSSSPLIKQLVPGFGKESNALFDYGRALAQALKINGWEWEFGVANGDADAIFLNYSPYGYQKRGLPVILFISLWRMVRLKKIPLFIYFHELYAGDNNWRTSSFWLYPLQKFLCHQFFKLSTKSFVGNEVMMELLKKGVPGYASKVAYAGLFSNVPVLPENINLRDRQANAVVFGSVGRRQEVYDQFTKLLKFCSINGIGKIIDIGFGEVELPKNFPIKIEVKGALPLQEVSQYLRENVYGFISYRDDLFGKSGIFAAYAGNGMVAVNYCAGNFKEKEGLSRSVHYLSVKDSVELIPNDKAQSMSDRLFGWYQTRSLKNHAKIIAFEVERALPH